MLQFLLFFQHCEWQLQAYLQKQKTGDLIERIEQGALGLPSMINSLLNGMIPTMLQVFMTVGVLGLSACGTVHGVGQDVENTGETIQDAAY